MPRLLGRSKQPMSGVDLMRHRAFFFLSLFAPLLLSGCSTYGYKTPIGETTYAPVDYHKVKLLFGPPAQPYEVIGVVTVDGGTWATEGDMYQKLLKSAAKLGADAVIVAGEGSYGTMVMPGVSTSTGTANVTTDAYGNSTVTGAATTYSGPTYAGILPRDKGFAIKFTK